MIDKSEIIHLFRVHNLLVTISLLLAEYGCLQ